MRNRHHIRKYYEVEHHNTDDRNASQLPMIVAMSLFSRWGAGDFFHNDRKVYLSLNLVTTGWAEYVQAGRKGRVDAGSVFIAHKGESQQFCTGGGGILHKRTIILDGWLSEIMIERLGLNRLDVITPQNRPEMALHFRTIFALLRDKPPHYAAAASARAYAILIALAGSINSTQPAQLVRAIDFIGRSLNKPIGLADIAGAGAMSLRQCSRLFTLHCECSPVQFLIRQRMSVAAVMLSDSTVTAKETATKVGYQDPLHFSHQFKKHFGVSPREYQKGMRC